MYFVRLEALNGDHVDSLYISGSSVENIGIRVDEAIAIRRKRYPTVRAKNISYVGHLENA